MSSLMVEVSQGHAGIVLGQEVSRPDATDATGITRSTWRRCSEKRRMINGESALSQHLFNVAIRELVTAVSANTQKDE